MDVLRVGTRTSKLNQWLKRPLLNPRSIERKWFQRDFSEKIESIVYILYILSLLYAPDKHCGITKIVKDLLQTGRRRSLPRSRAKVRIRSEREAFICPSRSEELSYMHWNCTRKVWIDINNLEYDIDTNITINSISPEPWIELVLYVSGWVIG